MSSSSTKANPNVNSQAQAEGVGSIPELNRQSTEEQFFTPMAMESEPLLPSSSNGKRQVSFLNQEEEEEEGTSMARGHNTTHELASIQQQQYTAEEDLERGVIARNIQSFSFLGFQIYFRTADKLWGFLLSSLFLSFILFAAFLLGLLSRLLISPPSNSHVPIKNVIFMISDGFGPASQTMARNYWQTINNLDYSTQLPLDTILVGSSRTRSSSSLVTDSAAGATAFSCASKTYNGAIGVVGKSPADAKVCGTILEAASEIGMLTGLVVTSRITHATPASFSAHVLGRDDEDSIALQQIGNYSLGRRVDLMLGGGSCHFYPNTSSSSCRADAIDVFDLAKKHYGWNVGTGQASELTTSPLPLPYMNLFARDHLDYSIDASPQPTLSQMVSSALTSLTRKHGGFFLMIEGSRIDMAAHSNDPAAHIHEILAYNTAISVVKAYVDKNPDTLLISTSDHETGGLSVAVQPNASYPRYEWNPMALQPVTKSGEGVSRALAALDPMVDRPEFVRNIVLRNWLGIPLEQQSNADVVFLANASKPGVELEYKVGEIVSRRAEIGWATHGHSAVDVNLYAYGANSVLFAGNHENTDMGTLLSHLFSFDLPKLTRKLQQGNLKL